jgi:diguanylate cyclase (GGDEF)-like protein/PAS domain S-box-containing protein
MTASRVLLVDDEAANRDMLSRRLERRGYSVGTAASGAEALEAIEREPWAAVLLDVQMPGMSGLEVLQKVRERWTAAELPVLMVTAKDGSETIVAALDLGANDYVTKPVDFPVTVARLRTHIARKDAEDRLRASEERYALAARGANDGLWDWDIAAGQLHLSARWKGIVGCDEAEIDTAPHEWFDRVHAEDLPRLRHDLDAHLRSRTPHFENEHRLRHASGTFRWVVARGIAVRDRHNTPVRMAGSLSDITANKVVDPLTGLPNRMLLHDRLEHVLSPSEASGLGPCAVLLLDLDGYQLVADGHGQGHADELLRAVALRLESSLRLTDAVARPADIAAVHTLARLGGDEFVLVLHQVCDAVDATRVAERLQRALVRPFVIHDVEIFISASIGIALGRPGATPDDLLRDADTAMTKARAHGRGRIEVFETGMRRQVLERLQLDAALRIGLENHEFLPYYQPIVDLGSGALVGFEALIRWQRAGGRIVSPAVFVPTLEESGLIVPVGRQFVEDVCAQLRAWREQSPESRHLSVNVNFASSQFAEPDVLGTLMAAIDKAGLGPDAIVVEITESAAIGDIDRAAATLRQFRAAGLRVVLDDFGTGYSSLSWLHELPIAGIKLDRSFIAGERCHPAILAAVVSLAAQLGLTVTAEGIETNAQHAQLRELGCGYAQGYRFARPLDAEAAGALIRCQPRWLPDAADDAAATAA